MPALDDRVGGGESLRLQIGLQVVLVLTAWVSSLVDYFRYAHEATELFGVIVTTDVRGLVIAEIVRSAWLVVLGGGGVVLWRLGQTRGYLTRSQRAVLIVAAAGEVVASLQLLITAPSGTSDQAHAATVFAWIAINLCLSWGIVSVVRAEGAETRIASVLEGQVRAPGPTESGRD